MDGGSARNRTCMHAMAREVEMKGLCKPKRPNMQLCACAGRAGVLGNGAEHTTTTAAARFEPAPHLALQDEGDLHCCVCVLAAVGLGDRAAEGRALHPFAGVDGCGDMAAAGWPRHCPECTGCAESKHGPHGLLASCCKRCASL